MLCVPSEEKYNLRLFLAEQKYIKIVYSIDIGFGDLDKVYSSTAGFEISEWIVWNNIVGPLEKQILPLFST